MRRRLAVILLALAAAPARGQDGSAVPSALGSLERVAEARAGKRISQRFDPAFKKYSKRYFGVAFDWRYFKAQGFAESGLKPDATSWVGARGVMQLMPSTYQEIASHRPDFGAIDQPEWNIAAGILHDRDLWQLWENIPEAERYHFMFASYNAGEGTIGRALAVAKQKFPEPAWANIESIAPTVQRWRYIETLGYVRRIDSTYFKLTNPFAR